MPEFEDVTRQLKRDDRIEGSNEMARAVWALGHFGRSQSAATIARFIRAKTALNWEGSQASRFFRRNAKSPLFIRMLQPNGRYTFGLSAAGRAVYNEMFVTRPGQEPLKPIKDHPGSFVGPEFSFFGVGAGADPPPYRRKDAEKPQRQAELIEQLLKQNTRYKLLLTQIVTCERWEVEAVLAEIATAVGVKNWKKLPKEKEREDV